MSVKKLPSGKWFCECYPYGASGKRFRKQFATKGEALSFERRLMNKVNATLGDGSGPHLSDLINRWYEMYGKVLTSGDERKAKLDAVCARLNNPLAAEFDKNVFAVYRERRLSGEWNPKGKKKLSEATVNREQSYLHAVFAELKRLGEWDGENPLTGIRKFKEEEQELAFLYQDEIDRVLEACDASRNRDLGIVARIALATGARWGEVEGLKQSQVLPGRITYVKTKGKRNRTVPISPALQAMIPKKRGALFSSCYESFKAAIKKSGVDLPAGQLTHVLRHTFASHFMMRGGNILVLQRILGHSDINITMRYAHFAPSHLEDAVFLNPFDNRDGVTSGDKKSTTV